jgi:hypothetical protein
MKVFRFVFSLIIVGAVFFFGGDAFACGDLLLASQGVDFGKLSCGADGYVVLNPNSTDNLLGYEVNAKKIVKKSGAEGDAFALTKGGKVKVIEKVTGNEIVRFQCQKGKAGVTNIFSPTEPGQRFIVSKLDGPSQEMSYDTLEICSLTPISTPKSFVLTSPTPLGTSASAIFDTDNNLNANGFQNTLTLDSNNWYKPNKVKVYFGKDNSSSPNSLSIDFVDTATNQIASSLYNVYDVASTVPEFSSTQYDITLDYRFDLNSEIPTRIKNLINDVVAEFKAVMKENTKTSYSGYINLAGAYGLPERFLASTPSNPNPFIVRGIAPGDSVLSTVNLPASMFKQVNKNWLEFIDDITIFVKPVSYYREGTGAAVAGTSMNVLASAGDMTLLPVNYYPQGFNSATQLPFYGELRLNTALLNTLPDNALKRIIRHELQHAFGSADMLYPSYSPAPSKVQNGLYLGQKAVAANGNNPLQMDATSKHLAQSFVDNNLSDMGPTLPVTQPSYFSLTNIDKGMLADNGYCILGVNDNPCN